MKKLSSLLLGFILLFVFATGAQAQTVAPSVSVWLGEEEVQFTQNDPFIEKATTLVPAKPVLESFGYETSWDLETQTLHAVKGELSFALTRDVAIVEANEEVFELAVAPKIVNGTLYAPLRFLAENAGYKVGWDAETRAAELAVQDNKGFFWKVEKDGSEVYLLGSIHVGDDALYPIRPEVNLAYNQADHLVVEVNIAAPIDEAMVQKIQSFMMYDDGTILPDHIDAETYAKLQDILKEIGAPETAFDPFKAWQVSNELLALKSALNGYEASMGIDLYFLNKAMATNKSILELESIESQFTMLDSFSDEFNASTLKEGVDAFHSAAGTVEPLIKLWQSGDDEGLVAITEEMKEIPEYYKGMLSDRNIHMVEKIEGYLADENKDSYFVIAGYLHMLGDEGIVPLLQEKGYTVTRLLAE